MTDDVKNLKFHRICETVSMVGFISVYVKFLPCLLPNSMYRGGEKGMMGQHVSNLLTNIQSVLS